MFSKETDVANCRFENRDEKANATHVRYVLSDDRIYFDARAHALNAELIKSGNEQVRATHITGKRSQFFARECEITRDSDRARDGRGARENLGCTGKRIAPCGARGGEFEWRECSCVAEVIVTHDRVSNDEPPLLPSRHRGVCELVHPLATRATSGEGCNFCFESPDSFTRDLRLFGHSSSFFTFPSFLFPLWRIVL